MVLAAILAACAILAATADQAHSQDATGLIRAVSDGQGHQHSVYAKYSGSAGFVLVNAPSASTAALTFAAMGQNVTVSQDGARMGDGRLVWTGSDRATGTVAILVVNGTEVFGTVDTAGRTYVINPLSPTVHELLELDHSKFPPPHYGTVSGGASGDSSDMDMTPISRLESAYIGWKGYPKNDTVTIKVLVATTEAARNHTIFGTGERLSIMVEEKANDAYVANRLPIKIDTEHHSIEHYTDPGNVETSFRDLLNESKTGIDGIYAKIKNDKT